MSRYPRDNQAALIAFYGDPGRKEPAKQLVKVTPPYQMYYDGKPVKTISFHKKAAPGLIAALDKIWNYYDQDQSIIDDLGISKYAGTYNHRKVRGSSTKWSNHSYGAAIDINAEENGFNMAGNIPIPVIAAFKSEGFRWGGDYRSRKDPMHFEACSSGEPERTFEEWLQHYGMPPKEELKKVAAVPDDAEGDDPGIDYGTIEVSAAKRQPQKPQTLLPAISADQPDPVVESVQRNLTTLGYFEVGEIDGKFGSRTTAGIAAFMVDWGMSGEPIITPDLQTRLDNAVKQNWRRPINPERAKATELQIAQRAPEMASARQSRLTAAWTAIGSFFLAVFTAIADYFKEAMEWLAPIKSFFFGIPAWTWLILTAAIAGFLAYKAGQTSTKIKQAFREGERL